MKKLINFIAFIVDFFTPKEFDEDNATVKKREGIIHHLHVPDQAVGIYSWHNLFYETSTRTALPLDCMVTIRELSKIRHWCSGARQYLTTHEWISVLHSPTPKELFISIIEHIENRFDIT